MPFNQSVTPGRKGSKLAQVSFVAKIPKRKNFELEIGRFILACGL